MSDDRNEVPFVLCSLVELLERDAAVFAGSDMVTGWVHATETVKAWSRGYVGSMVQTGRADEADRFVRVTLRRDGAGEGSGR